MTEPGSTVKRQVVDGPLGAEGLGQVLRSRSRPSPGRCGWSGSWLAGDSHGAYPNRALDFDRICGWCNYSVRCQVRSTARFGQARQQGGQLGRIVQLEIGDRAQLDHLADRDGDGRPAGALGPGPDRRTAGRSPRSSPANSAARHGRAEQLGPARSPWTVPESGSPAPACPAGCPGRARRPAAAPAGRVRPAPARGSLGLPDVQHQRQPLVLQPDPGRQQRRRASRRSAARPGGSSRVFSSPACQVSAPCRPLTTSSSGSGPARRARARCARPGR